MRNQRSGNGPFAGFNTHERSKVLSLLASKGEQTRGLYERADRVRHAHMGDEVFIQGIIECSQGSRLLEELWARARAILLNHYEPVV